jgi:hypothetical protein
MFTPGSFKAGFGFVSGFAKEGGSSWIFKNTKKNDEVIEG